MQNRRQFSSKIFFLPLVNQFESYNMQVKLATSNKLKKYNFSSNCLDPKIYHPFVMGFQWKRTTRNLGTKKYIT